jgi:thiol-disulfide isomerase/thioredoxin
MNRPAGYLALTSLLVCLTAHALPPGIMPVADRAAPALQLKDFNGKPYHLADTAGHWRFVHFWASWCAPCRREMPGIQRAIPRLAGSGIEFVLVNTAESEDDVFTFLATVAPELTPLMDTDGLVTAAWQPRGLPATFLVDPQGMIRYQALGGRHWNEPVYLDFLRSLPGRVSTTTTPAGSR